MKTIIVLLVLALGFYFPGVYLTNSYLLGISTGIFIVCTSSMDVFEWFTYDNISFFLFGGVSLPRF